MRKSVDEKGGVKVMWNLVWPETFRALDAEAMKAGPVMGRLVRVQVPTHVAFGAAQKTGNRRSIR